MEVKRMDSEPVVTIPLSRYESLLDTETRVDVAVERVFNDNSTGIEDILRILGTELALCKADEIRTAEEAMLAKYRKCSD